ncbi:MAG: hypothetical protein IPK59_23255 [Rhodospirillaceae bacterium]|nr:hypothetical protein [Rhodospirillaceae bacterium]
MPDAGDQTARLKLIEIAPPCTALAVSIAGRKVTLADAVLAFAGELQDMSLVLGEHGGLSVQQLTPFKSVSEKACSGSSQTLGKNFVSLSRLLGVPIGGFHLEQRFLVAIPKPFDLVRRVVSDAALAGGMLGRERLAVARRLAKAFDYIAHGSGLRSAGDARNSCSQSSTPPLTFQARSCIFKIMTKLPHKMRGYVRHLPRVPGHLQAAKLRAFGLTDTVIYTEGDGGEGIVALIRALRGEAVVDAVHLLAPPKGKTSDRPRLRFGMPSTISRPRARQSSKWIAGATRPFWRSAML